MNLIVAVDQNWAIGKDGDQLCYLKEDLKRFKALTLGHPVIMGRNTRDALPGERPLQGRRNMVLSRKGVFLVKGWEVFRSLDSLLAAAPHDSFVIGGGSVYKALLPYCDTAYVTKIDHAFPDADVWFPSLDADPDWEVTQEEPPLEQDGLKYQYVTYKRIGAAKEYGLNESDAKRPHLECPKCGKAVTSLKEWRDVSRWPKTYQCPYCQYGYTVPFQGTQLGVYVGVGVLCFLPYLYIIKPFIELLSVGTIVQKIIDGVVMLGCALVGFKPAGKFGEKMAYKHPLQ